jgi:SAM-dependent methyltransferase
MSSEWWNDYFDEDFLRIYRHLLPDREAPEAVASIVELVRLEPGSLVLDLACGWGRHAVELARLGLRVIGLDRSEFLLRHARHTAAPGESIEWVQADMRELPFRGGFAVVLSLFSSLGYFVSDEEDVRVLQGVRTILDSDGYFILETMHRDASVREYAERDWWWGEDGERVWVEREFDPIRGVTRETLRWLRRDGTGGEKLHAARVRTATEWDRMLQAAGLRPVGWYGGWGLNPFEYTSESLIVVARPAV